MNFTLFKDKNPCIGIFVEKIVYYLVDLFNLGYILIDKNTNFPYVGNYNQEITQIQNYTGYAHIVQIRPSI